MPHAHEGPGTTTRGRLDRPVLGIAEVSPQTTHVLVLVVLTLVCGLVVGLARGGTLGAFARVHVYRPWLFAVLVLVLAVGGLVPALHSPAWIAAAVLAALFAGMNNRLPGLGLLVTGIIANAAVITANGGEMPVSLWGAHRARVPVDDILASAFHTPAGGGTSLRLLSDLIPFPFPGVPAVLSVGDVAIAAALGVFGAVTPVRAFRTLQARRNAALAGALPPMYGGTGRTRPEPTPAGRDEPAHHDETAAYSGTTEHDETAAYERPAARQAAHDDSDEPDDWDEPDQTGGWDEPDAWPDEPEQDAPRAGDHDSRNGTDAAGGSRISERGRVVSAWDDDPVEDDSGTMTGRPRR